jgi:hypothetical protein
VIDNIFVKSNIYLKELELDAAQFVIDQINPKNVVRPPDEVHIEGGCYALERLHIYRYLQR